MQRLQLFLVSTALLCVAGTVTAQVTTTAAPTNPPQQNTSDPHAIVRQVREFLDLHSVEGTRCWPAMNPPHNTTCYDYHFYRPSLTKYAAGQWLWDSGSHMISWSHLNATNSMRDLHTMLQMQRDDGFIPETTFWAVQDATTDANNLLFYGNTQYTQISQMPVLAFSLRAIHNATRNETFVREVLPRLARYWDWWKNTRIFSDSGLVSILHGWESGLDASPMYDGAYNVSARPTFEEMYPHFPALMTSYNLLYGWNMTAMGERTAAPPGLGTMYDAWFYVEDVGVNSVYAAGWGILADLSEEVAHGDRYYELLAKYCREQELLFTARIVASAWSAEHQRFVSRWRARNGTWLVASEETVQSLLPLLLNISDPLIKSIINTQLLNTSKFWTGVPVPSTAADSPSFEPVFTVDLMWRGPMWPFPTWMVMEGLWRHGYTSTVEEILDRWTAAVESQGIWEMYNPLNGTAYGVEGLGMSCIIVDWLYRLGRV
jgi:hypothetical protein